MYFNNMGRELDTYIIYSKYDEEDDYDQILIEYDYSDKRLYIDSSVLKFMTKHLPFKLYEIRVLIWKWFSKKEDVEVGFTDTPVVMIE